MEVATYNDIHQDTSGFIQGVNSIALALTHPRCGSCMATCHGRHRMINEMFEFRSIVTLSQTNLKSHAWQTPRCFFHRATKQEKFNRRKVRNKAVPGRRFSEFPVLLFRLIVASLFFRIPDSTLPFDCRFNISLNSHFFLILNSILPILLRNLPCQFIFWWTGTCCGF